jgi:hypothetical protein
MIKLIFDNPSIENSEKTTLLSDVSSGGTSLSVKNNDSFAANDYIIVGTPGQETTEVRKIQSVSGNETIVVDALSFDHESSVTITKIDYNQVQIYRSATETGTYTLISTVDIQVDSPSGTSYDDETGDVSMWYKIRFYNSTTTDTSYYSDLIEGSGYPYNSLHQMTDDILELINDKEEKYITRDEIKRKINRKQKKWWYSPYTKRDLIEEATLDTVASQNYITLPTDFDKLKDDYSVKFNHVEGTTDDDYYCLKVVSKAQFYEDFGDNLADDSDDLEKCAIDVANNKLLIGPTPITAGLDVIMEYYKKPTDLSEENDTTVCSVPDIIILDVAIEIEQIRGNFDKAKELKAERNDLIAGDLEHNRTRAGATKMIFKRSYDSARYK